MKCLWQGCFKTKMVVKGRRIIYEFSLIPKPIAPSRALASIPHQIATPAPQALLLPRGNSKRTLTIKAMVASQISHLGWKSKSQHTLRVDRLFIFVFIGTALLMAWLSIRYSRLLNTKNDKAWRNTESSPGVSGAFVAEKTEQKSSAAVHNTKYDNDRVYCMVPFIWNKDIYDVSEFTQGILIKIIASFCITRMLTIAYSQLWTHGARNAT